MSRSPVAFGSYVITRRIARGGMAEIYRAQRRGAVGKAWVALKMMRPSLEHEELREQLFQREARIAALIHHPHVVELLEFGEEQGHKFLAMEYVRGRDLSHLIHPRGEGTGEALAPELGLTIVLHAAAGLGHAHRLVDPSTGAHLAIVHRDISPGNVMVGYDGTVKVLDFGVARINETHGMRTQTGTLRGKFAYMSPEQTLGSGVDARSDVFSLGTVLYELLTGSNPFRARNAMTTIERVQRVRPVPPSRSNRAIPREVDELLARCLAKDPKRRFADATELCEALDRLLGARGRASEADIAGLMRGRFAWEQGEEEKELAEEAESAALIEVVDFAVGGEDRGLDAPNVAVSQEDVAEPAALGAAAREPVEAAAEEDVYGVFDSAEDERTVAQPSPVMARGPRPATPERPRAPSRTARGASSAAVADVVPVVDLGGASDDATAVGAARARRRDRDGRGGLGARPAPLRGGAGGGRAWSYRPALRRARRGHRRTPGHRAHRGDRRAAAGAARPVTAGLPGLAAALGCRRAAGGGRRGARRGAGRGGVVDGPGTPPRGRQCAQEDRARVHRRERRPRGVAHRGSAAPRGPAGRVAAARR